MKNSLLDSSRPVFANDGIIWQYRTYQETGLINISEMARLYDQDVKYWLELGETLHMISVLAEQLNVAPQRPVDGRITDFKTASQAYPELVRQSLYKVQEGEDAEIIAHPFLAAQYAFWLGAEFGVAFQIQQTQWIISTDVFCDLRYTAKLHENPPFLIQE